MLVAAVSITAAGFAQKFESGDKNLEVNFAPIGGSTISMNNIRFRMFNSESLAIRVGFGLSLANEKTTSNTSIALNSVTADGKTTLFKNTSTFNFNIRPGYEMHFEETDLLYPYIGAELAIDMQKHTMESEYENGTTVNQVETTTITG
jgi:hypothetical protein